MKSWNEKKTWMQEIKGFFRRSQPSQEGTIRMVILMVITWCRNELRAPT